MNNRYTILKREFLPDNGCYLTIYSHNKTKAQVLYFELDEIAMSSLVMVRTPSENDKGIYHIIEHCVLSGSKKYNCKDPFKEIEKRSLSSYMNAITYNDKTLYPFTTVNQADFYNILDVYLDGIFNPLMLQNEQIIAKEGIHFEIQKGKIIPNGIVYNEMKGIEGNQNACINLASRRVLYQNSFNSFFAGGLTEKIRTVNASEVISSYYKAYYPSNMTFIVAGDVNIERYLSVLDTYISKYEYREPISINYYNHVVDKHYVKVRLSKDCANIFAMSYRMPFKNDIKAITALSILNYLLIDIEGSPLKLELERHNISGNLYSDMDDSLNPLCEIIIESDNDLGKVPAKYINEFFKKKASSLIDRERIESTINYFYFMASEEDYDSLPKGLALAIGLTNDILYENKSFDRLRRKSLYDDLKNELGTSYFEDVLKSAYLKNDNYVVVKGYPKYKKLNTGRFRHKKGYVLKEMQEFDKYLKSKDDTSNLKGLPLDLISPNPIKYEYKINDNLIFIKNKVNNITYLKLMFDISDFPLDELSTASILSHNLAIFKMKDMTCDEFTIEANKIGGGITTDISFYTDRTTKKIKRYFVCDMSCFEDKIEENVNLLKKMLFETDFDDEKGILYWLKSLQQEETNDYNYLYERIYKLEGLKSYSQIGYFLDATQGYLFFQKLDDLIDYEKRAAYLKKILDKILDKSRVSLAIYGKNDNAKFILDDIKLENKIAKIKSYDLNPDFKSKGFVINGISSNMLVIPAAKRAPAADILVKILENYLWNLIRNENGAYHIQAYADSNGNIIMYSRQDPNLELTYQIMEQSLDAILDMDLKEEDIKDYIISFFSETTATQSAFLQFNLIMRVILENYDYETRRKNRVGVLNLKPQDIKDYALYLKGELKHAIKISMYDELTIKKANLFDEKYDLR